MDGTHASLASLDWASVAAELDSHGCAVIGPVLPRNNASHSRPRMTRKGFSEAGS